MSRVVKIDRLAEVVGASLDQTVRAIKINLFSAVIMDTRVDTGRLRGNWQTTTGTPAYAQIERLDPSGTQAVAETQRVQAESVDYLSNNLPYAEVWEERDAMVEKNVARIERIVQEASR